MLDSQYKLNIIYLIKYKLNIRNLDCFTGISRSIQCVPKKNGTLTLNGYIF